MSELSAQVSQLEMLSVIERRLQTSDIEALKKKVGSLSDKVPGKQSLPE